MVSDSSLSIMNESHWRKPEEVPSIPPSFHTDQLLKKKQKHTFLFSIPSKEIYHFSQSSPPKFSGCFQGWLLYHYCTDGPSTYNSSIYDFSTLRTCESDMHLVETILQILNSDLFLAGHIQSDALLWFWTVSLSSQSAT